jgi:8-oxo-dGTP pyrophosphatase MutT (NUDIX family)
MTTAVAPAPDTPAVTVSASGRWRGVLGLMDAWSADGRMLEAPDDGVAVRARPLPLPLLVQPELAPGHDGGKLGVGVIDRIWTEQGFVMGEGRFDMEDPAGAELARKVGLGFIRFVSLDVDDATAQQVCLGPDGQLLPDCNPNDPTAEMGMIYSGWRVMGATLLAHPAFPDAHIALADDAGQSTAQSAQAAVRLADTAPAAPSDPNAPVVGYDPAWGCVVPNTDGTAWEPADCNAEGAVEADPTGDGPFDPEQVAAAATPPVAEEAVQDEGTGCVAPDPANDGAWLPADCTAEGAVPANDTGDAPAEEVTDAANLADQELSVRLAARLATLAAGDPTHAGVAIKAMDTGRILLLQRALDPTDPASGLWEFPGGSIERGEDPQAAAWREFQEETGVALPDSVTVVDGYRSPNGIYQCYIATVPAEADIPINPDTDNREENPDMTDADQPEVAAWFDPATLPGMASLRPELEDTPWDQIAAAGTDTAPPADAPAAPADAAAATYALPLPTQDTPSQDGAAPGDATDTGDAADKDQGNGCVCPQDDDTWAPCECTLDEAVTADEDGQPLAAEEDDTQLAAMPADCKPCQAVAITASAAGDPAVLVASATGWRPPAAFFDEPVMDAPRAITVDPATGQISGLLAVWGTCHVGFRDRCITPPRSRSGYGFFHTAPLPTDGGVLDVGLITMDTGHAALDLTASSTVSHYDNTGTQAAVVRAGENEFGIWVAGVTLPFVSAEERLRLSLASFSGDWRQIRGGAELVAALAVNTPGFPMPARRTGTDNTEYALVAAGFIPPAPAPDQTPATTGVTNVTASVDPQAVADLVLAALDKRDARRARYTTATAALGQVKAAATAARFGTAAGKVAALAASLRADRTTLARTRITGLDIEIPKGIRATPSDLELATRKDFANWVDQQGGLPRKIKSVAKHLQAKGMGESQSIAVAVNVARKACSSGDTNWPGKQTINAQSKAEYCAAIARWETMKAAAKAN